MDRILALGLAMALATTMALPLGTTNAAAHNCQSDEAGGCGPCEEGEDHAHSDPDYKCSSEGSSAIPAVGVPALAAALGAAVLARDRARR